MHCVKTSRTPPALPHLKGCNAEEINAQLEVIHNQAATTREAAAQALSVLLNGGAEGFHFDVDLDCEEPQTEPAPPVEPDANEDADDDEDKDRSTTP